MKIAIGNDHAAIEMKQHLVQYLRDRGHEVQDFGIGPGESADYPCQAEKVAKAVASGEAERGIVICGTGVGISIAANKVKGVRCCCCSDCYSAKMSRAHNDANMLALGGRVIAPELAKMIVEIWVKGEFEGGRHQRRINMFKTIEAGEPLE